MAKKKFVPIPRAGKQGKDILALAQNIEQIMGARGDDLDSMPTWRDLLELGFVQTNGRRGNYTASLPDEIAAGITDQVGIEFPTIPTSVETSVSLSYVFVTWDLPSFGGYAQTEVYRSFDDDFVTSTLIGTSNSGIYADRIDYEVTAYYWVRHVNMANVKGPIQSTAGISAVPSERPSEILSQLEGKVTASELHQDLSSRIDLIDAPGTGLVDELAAEINTRSTQVSQLNSGIDGVASSVESEEQARISADSALASSINQVSTTVNGHTATLQTYGSSIDGLNAKYTVKVDANGYVAGYGLAVEDNNGAPTSSMQFLVDQFSIVSPGNSALAFAVESGKVVMDGALIKTASIESAAIGSLAADKIAAGTVSVAMTFTAAHINGGSLNIANKFTVDSLGNVLIRNAASGARLEMRNNVIKVFDQNNVMRVRIGDLSA